MSSLSRPRLKAAVEARAMEFAERVEEFLQASVRHTGDCAARMLARDRSDPDLSQTAARRRTIR
jgi:hypothetical protein